MSANLIQYHRIVRCHSRLSRRGRTISLEETASSGSAATPPRGAGITNVTCAPRHEGTIALCYSHGRHPTMEA